MMPLQKSCKLAWRPARLKSPEKYIPNRFLKIGKLAWCAGTLRLQNSLGMVKIVFFSNFLIRTFSKHTV
jgi:hypothetical protein